MGSVAIFCAYGDSYIAGFLTGIVDGLSIEGAMEKGAANATETLKYFGAW